MSGKNITGNRSAMQRGTQKPSPWNYEDSTKRPKELSTSRSIVENPDLQGAQPRCWGARNTPARQLQDARNDCNIDP
jgi:hypothetical protein